MAGKPTRSKRRGASGEVLPFGTAGARALTVDDMPSHFGQSAGDKWAELIATHNADPAAPKLLLSDREVCAAYCDLWGDYTSARRMITEVTLALRNDGGQIEPNPYLAIAHRAQQQLRLLAVELGLTPASRPRVHRGDADEPPAVPAPQSPSEPPGPSKLSRLRLRFA